MADTPPPPYPVQGDTTMNEKAPYYSGPPTQPVYGQPQQYPGPPQNYVPPQQQYPGQPPQPYVQPQYPGQQPGYMPQQPGQPPVQYTTGQATTVVVTQPTIARFPANYGPSPCNIKCPQCNADITTSTSSSVGSMAWMVAGIICLIGCFFPFLWFGCCLIPLCIPSLHDVTHKCPHCNGTLGTFKRAF